MLKRRKTIYLFSGLIPLAILLIAWYFNDFFPFGNKSFLAIDFNAQFIDFFIFMRNTVLSGDWSSLFYSFSKSLGGNMVGTWAYYLLSPFNIFYLILPISQISYAIFFSIFLRYGAIGLSFAYYLVKRQQGEKNPFLTILLASAYALNGYVVSYQMLPILMDALWLLPLILVGLEELLDGKKPYKYALLLSLAFILQYYMAYMISLFIFIYTFYYLFITKEQEPWKEYLFACLKKISRLAVFSFLGIALTAFILLPNIYNLLFSKGDLNTSLTFAWEFQINPLDIFSKFMIGAFDNNSWSRGPNLPNIYIGSLALVGVTLYFMAAKIKSKHKWASLAVLTVFFFSITHEFTSKIWHLGQNPAGFFYRFSWILVFFLLVLAYQGLNQKVIKSYHVFIGSALMLIIQTVLISKEFTFLTAEQLQFSALLFGIVWLILFFGKQRLWMWAALSLLTFTELGINTYFSQEDLNFADTYKFENALNVLDEAIEPIRPDDNNFYRISKTFYRSKNDPFTFNYPGLTNFSSNLETSTRELFERLGNNAVDASTIYFGTPLTDALFGVKYFVENDNNLPANPEQEDRTYVFSNHVTRLDVTQEQNLVNQTDRFSIYEVPNTLPIAFGISDESATLTLVDNEPIDNQQEIAAALDQSPTDFFEAIDVSEMELVNAEETSTASGRLEVKRVSDSADGEIHFQYTPATEDPYFVLLPRSLSTNSNEVSLKLNDEFVSYRKKFRRDQLINIAYEANNQPQKFSVLLKTNESYNLSDLQIVRVDTSSINRLIEDLQTEAMRVDEWDANYIKGTITIEDSPWVLTSIPYDDSWEVKVDGEVIEIEEVWDSLLAFKVDAGEHLIEMTYKPNGLAVGVAVTFITGILFVSIYYLDKQKDEEKIKVNRKRG